MSAFSQSISSSGHSITSAEKYSSNPSDTRFRVPTHSQAHPEDGSFHISDLSKSQKTTTTSTTGTDHSLSIHPASSTESADRAGFVYPSRRRRTVPDSVDSSQADSTASRKIQPSMPSQSQPNQKSRYSAPESVMRLPSFRRRPSSENLLSNENPHDGSLFRSNGLDDTAGDGGDASEFKVVLPSSPEDGVEDGADMDYVYNQRGVDDEDDSAVQADQIANVGNSKRTQQGNRARRGTSASSRSNKRKRASSGSVQGGAESTEEDVEDASMRSSRVRGKRGPRASTPRSRRQAENMGKQQDKKKREQLEQLRRQSEKRSSERRAPDSSRKRSRGETKAEDEDEGNESDSSDASFTSMEQFAPPQEEKGRRRRRSKKRVNEPTKQTRSLARGGPFQRRKDQFHPAKVSRVGLSSGRRGRKYSELLLMQQLHQQRQRSTPPARSTRQFLAGPATRLAEQRIAKVIALSLEDSSWEPQVEVGPGASSEMGAQTPEAGLVGNASRPRTELASELASNTASDVEPVSTRRRRGRAARETDVAEETLPDRTDISQLPTKLPSKVPQRKSRMSAAGPATFKPFLNSQTGGTLQSASTTRKSSLRMTWDDLSQVEYSGPVDLVDSSPIESFSMPSRPSRTGPPRQARAAPVARIGGHLIPQLPTTHQQARAEPEYHSGIDSDGIESGDELDVLRAKQSQQQIRLAGMDTDVSATQANTQQQSEAGQPIAASEIANTTQSSQRATQHAPSSPAGKAFIVEQIEASLHIPPYIKPTIVAFVNQTPSFLPDENILARKEQWILEVGPARKSSGRRGDKLALLIERSPPSFSLQQVNEQIAKLLRGDYRHSPWLDETGRELNPQTGLPLDNAVGHDVVLASEHVQLQRNHNQACEEVEGLKTLKESNELEKQQLGAKIIELERGLAEAKGELNNVDQSHRKAIGEIIELRSQNNKLIGDANWLQRRSNHGVRAQIKLHSMSKEKLQEELDSTKTQLQLLTDQHAKTDKEIRRKAGELDKIREREADAETARQQRQRDLAAAREAEKEQLRAAAEATGTDVETEMQRKRALLLLGASAAEGGGPDRGEGRAIVDSTQTNDGATTVNAQGAADDVEIVDEIAALAAEAAAAAAVGMDTNEIGEGTTGRGARRNKRVEPAANVSTTAPLANHNAENAQPAAPHVSSTESLAANSLHANTNVPPS